MKIPSPPPQQMTPDRDTRKAPYTSGDGDGQVFHFQKFGIRYGTDDKGHAAALVLAVLLFVGILLCLVAGSLGKDYEFAIEIAKIFSSAFLIVTGIAVGKAPKS